MKEAFERIYRENEWNGGSGPGSSAENSEPYLTYLRRIVDTLLPCRILDLGCGDWRLYERFTWGEGIQYLGIDIVDSVITENRKFSRSNISFRCCEVSELDMQRFDLVIIKDVLQHLSHRQISRLLGHCCNIPFLLVTNDVTTLCERDIADGNYRPVDLRMPPYSWTAKSCLEFESLPTRKIAVLFDSERTLPNTTKTIGIRAEEIDRAGARPPFKY